MGVALDPSALGDSQGQWQSVSQPAPDLPLEQSQSQVQQGMQSIQAPQTAGSPSGVKALLGNFFKTAGTVLMHDFGMPTEEDKRQRDFRNQILASQANATMSSAQAAADYHRAQASQWENVQVMGPDGVTPMDMPRKSVAQYLSGQVRAQTAATAEQGRNTRFDLGIQSKEDLQRFVQEQMNQRFSAGEIGKNQRAAMVQKFIGSYQPLMDNNGQITGFYNSKNPSVVVRPPETIGERKTALPMEAQKISENAQSGLRALSHLEQMIKANPNLLIMEAIPGSLGARELSTAKKEVADVITRLRTGAALNEEEQKFYGGQVPGALDLTEPGAIDYKLDLLKKLFTGLGSMKGNLPAERKTQAPEGTKIRVNGQVQVKRGGKWVLQ